MMRPTLSILIPLYNAAPWLEACMQSVLAQTMPADEIILVDNGSDDGSAQLCDAWAQRMPKVQVIHQANLGVSAARNTALAAAKGELIMFVDADDWVEPEIAERLWQLMERTGVPLTACNHWIERGNRAEKCFAAPQGEVLMTAREALENILWHDAPDVSCWGKLFRREVLQGVRFPEGRLYEDTWTIAQVLMQAGQMAWIDTALYHYRIRPDSISRSVWGEEKMDYAVAVEQLTQTVRSTWPDMEDGCIRRQAHALLSVRRYFVGCPKALKPRRDALERSALALADRVLHMPRAPRRDKIALRALMLGPWAYDLLWKLRKH